MTRIADPIPFLYEELDVQHTELGELVLRRRCSAGFGGKVVYEVTIDGEFLMSSHVNDAEIALARLGLASFDREIDVMVGGLGLGHTAASALDLPNVRSLTVVELLAPVIGWHKDNLVPLGTQLLTDVRCRIVQRDFFDHVTQPGDGATWDAILLDIDHSPEFLLHPRNRAFYEGDGPRSLTAILATDGVFALWSADPPGEDFLDNLRTAFADVTTHEIQFAVPQLDCDDTNVIVVARRD